MKKTVITTILLILLNINSFATEENNITIDENSTIEVNTGNCIGCHGEDFEKPAMGMSQIVKDMTKEYIEATLFNYKYNSTTGKMDALMSWQTAKLTDDEIRAIAQKLGK